MKKRKRKLKKGFKRFIFILLLLVIAFFVYFLNKENIINLNNIWQDAKSIFTKDKDSNAVEENNITNDFANLFKTRLPSKGLEFSETGEILPNGDMKIFIKGENGNSGYIYVNTNDKAEYVWITFVSAIDAEPLKTKLKTDLENLDYIDLRFSNKVFYKFKDDSIDGLDVEQDSISPAVEIIATSSEESVEETSNQNNISTEIMMMAQPVATSTDENN